MAERREAPDLLERQGELEAIDSLLSAAAGGSGGLLYLEGAPGVGKTRLLRAAHERALEQGLGVLRARGSQLEREFPHSLVRQLLEAPLAQAAPGERDRLLAGAARHAKRALGLEPAGDQGAASADGASVLHGLYWVCAGLAERKPLALLVDDVHWADSPSLRFLAYLAARLDELPVALLVAARPGERGVERTALLRLAADPAAVLLQPRPLTGAAVATIVAADLAGDADPAFVDACRAATGGNPFLLHELLRACAEDGVAPSRASASRVAEMVPDTVSHAILLRLGRLMPEATQVARAVAVLGQEADVRRVAAVTGLDQAQVGEAADALAASALLRPGRPLAFTHPLVQAAVARDMPASERTDRHARVGHLLRAEGAPAERVALHLLPQSS